MTTTTLPTTIEELYRAIQTRPRPEDVAELVIAAIGATFTPNEATIASEAAQYSYRRLGYTWSSMSTEFARPASATKQTTTAAGLFAVPRLTPETGCDPATVDAFIDQVSSMIHRARKSMEKLNKTERHARGLFKTQRWYNTRWRVCLHLEDKLRRLTRETRKHQFTRVGTSGLLSFVAFDDFRDDPNTACLAAYLSARTGRRSVFTNGKQDRAFDRLSAMLLARCERSATTRWDVLARIMPDTAVISHLTDEQRGHMLGQWWTMLTDMADLLQSISVVGDVDLAKMIVTRGVDSTTWNTTASGWNQARGHWISLVHALGLETILDEICPGKVMRLMAADVVRWHAASNDAIHPDTRVWAALPKPWEVVTGTARCTRSTIVEACNAAGVNPTSWVEPRGTREDVPYRMTQELVHGVAISSPTLAQALRRCSAFSGKALTSPPPGNIAIAVDAHGYVLAAE